MQVFNYRDLATVICLQYGPRLPYLRMQVSDHESLRRMGVDERALARTVTCESWVLHFCEDTKRGIFFDGNILLIPQRRLPP